jgi:hypothetical protein
MPSAQRFALAAGGRDEIRFESRKKPEARKMLVSRDESHQSAARFVGRFSILLDILPEKQEQN